MSDRDARIEAATDAATETYRELRDSLYETSGGAFAGDPLLHWMPQIVLSALAAADAVQGGDGKRMVDLNAVIEALDDVASKVLPGSDPMACVRAAAGVIEREFGGPAPSEEGIDA